MRSNGGMIGPQNIGAKGIWRVDDQQRGGVIMPESEAAAAGSPDTYVLDMTDGAGANGTGVGAGLTGADLVATQVNNVAGYNGWGRPFVKSGYPHMTMTPEALASLLTGAECTLQIHLRNLQAAVGGLCYIDTSAGPLYIFNAGPRVIQCVIGSLTMVVPLGPDTSECWLALWYKANMGHLGWRSGLAPIGGWYDIPRDQRVCLYGAGITGATVTKGEVLGTSSTGWGAAEVEIAHLIMSRRGLTPAPQ